LRSRFDDAKSHVAISDFRNIVADGIVVYNGWS
jgi:hypothetical protein